MVFFSLLLLGCNSPPEQQPANSTNLANATQPAPPVGTKGQFAFCEVYEENSLEKDDCILNSSIYYLNQSGCILLMSPTYHDKCLEYFANYTYKMLLCDELFSASLRQECFGQFEEGRIASACFALPANGRDSCFHELAVEKNRSGFCNSIRDPGKMDSCYSVSAKKNLNPDLCLGVGPWSDRDLCYYDVSLLSLNSTICENIRGQLKNDCYFRIAIATRNAGVCSSIEVGDLAASCFLDIAKTTNQPSLCDLIPAIFPEMDECFYYFSGIDRNVTYCHKIIDAGVRDKCLASAAKIGMNHSICL
ncbi:MAG: hypothetical protein V1658_00525, partial [Candidatus Micrarchaeota archaeon]